MSNSNEKKRYGLTRKQEKQAGEFLGKHVSKEKAAVLFIATTLVCLMPALIGIRLWDKIPEIVETGLIGVSGEDDSLPRAVLVFGIAGLMAVLNTICHGQLFFNQQMQRLAPQASRIVGRWGFPILSSICTAILIYNAADTSYKNYLPPCILSLIIMLVGSHFFDCKRGSAVSFNFSFLKYNENIWKLTHRVAGICWLLSGLLIQFFISYYGTLPISVCILSLFIMCIPILVGKYLSVKSKL